MERKCFDYRGFGHIICHCKKREEEELVSIPLNRFEVLKNSIIQRKEGSRKKEEKDRRTILREEKLKEKPVKVRKTRVKKKKRNREQKEKKKSC